MGTHVPVGKGLAEDGLARAHAIGAEVIQVFTGNPRGWAPPKANPAKDEAFREGCTAAGIRVVLHAPYLVNLGSPNAVTFERSVGSVAANLRRAREIGAEAVVVHTGSCVDDGQYDAALGQVRTGLLPLLDDLDADGPWLLLEPTAGQGRSLCATVADVEGYLEALDRHPRAGICLDTCHAFAAGEPLDGPGGTTDTVDRLVAVAGPGRLRLVHANDSKDGRGALKDRHERIGEGRIGLGAFEKLFAHPALNGVPFVLETPGAREVGDAGLPLLRRLRQEAAARTVQGTST